MKKEYLKPTARSHELRCNRIMAASLEEGKIQMGDSSFYSGSDSDSDSGSDEGFFYNPGYVDL